MTPEEKLKRLHRLAEIDCPDLQREDFEWLTKELRQAWAKEKEITKPEIALVLYLMDIKKLREELADCHAKLEIKDFSNTADRSMLEIGYEAKVKVLQMELTATQNKLATLQLYYDRFVEELKEKTGMLKETADHFGAISTLGEGVQVQMAIYAVLEKWKGEVREVK